MITRSQHRLLRIRGRAQTLVQVLAMALVLIPARLAETAARRRSDRGAGFVEYGMLLVLVAAVCVATIRILGANIGDGFTSASNSMPPVP